MQKAKHIMGPSRQMGQIAKCQPDSYRWRVNPVLSEGIRFAQKARLDVATLVDNPKTWPAVLGN